MLISDFCNYLVSNDFKNVDAINRPGKTYDYWTLDFPVDFLCFTPDEIEKKKYLHNKKPFISFRFYKKNENSLTII